MAVELDLAEGLGAFAEVETLAASEDDLAGAAAIVVTMSAVGIENRFVRAARTRGDGRFACLVSVIATPCIPTSRLDQAIYLAYRALNLTRLP